jgi:hypothetical protein
MLYAKTQPKINSVLSPPHQCIINVFRACVGLPPDNFMLLEHRVRSHTHVLPCLRE